MENLIVVVLVVGSIVIGVVIGARIKNRRKE
jgi:hypothetical protein